jgi:hypothetical protein
MRSDVRGILPTARPELLAVFLASWFNPLSPCRDIPVSIMTFGHPLSDFVDVITPYMRASDPEEDKVRFVGHFQEYQAVYPARVEMMLQLPNIQTFINLDDDMEVIPEHTDYEPAIKRSREFGVGVISCAWAKSEALLAKALQGKELPWIKQPIVNMAGGQVYGQHVVREMARKIEPYQFDDVQAALRAYVAGYENWRYRGSIIYHRIMKPGGLKVAFAQVPHAANDPEYMNLHYSVPVKGREEVPENNRLMPSTGNLVRLAHLHHQKNRHALGFR